MRILSNVNNAFQKMKEKYYLNKRINEGCAKIEGHTVGEFKGYPVIIISENAYCSSNILCDVLIVKGTLHGTVNVKDLIIYPTGKIYASEVSYDHLTIHENGVLEENLDSISIYRHYLYDKNKSSLQSENLDKIPFPDKGDLNIKKNWDSAAELNISDDAADLSISDDVTELNIPSVPENENKDNTDESKSDNLKVTPDYPTFINSF